MALGVTSIHDLNIERVPVSDIIIYEKYDKTADNPVAGGNDLALLQLARERVVGPFPFPQFCVTDQ